MNNNPTQAKCGLFKQNIMHFLLPTTILDYIKGKEKRITVNKSNYIG